MVGRMKVATLCAKLYLLGCKLGCNSTVEKGEVMVGFMGQIERADDEWTTTLSNGNFVSVYK